MEIHDLKEAIEGLGYGSIESAVNNVRGSLCLCLALESWISFLEKQENRPKFILESFAEFFPVGIKIMLIYSEKRSLEKLNLLLEEIRNLYAELNMEINVESELPIEYRSINKQLTLIEDEEQPQPENEEQPQPENEEQPRNESKYETEMKICLNGLGLLSSYKSGKRASKFLGLIVTIINIGLSGAEESLNDDKKTIPFVRERMTKNIVKIREFLIELDNII